MKGRQPIALGLLLIAASACARVHGPLELEIRDAQAGGSGQAGRARAEGASAGKKGAAGSAGTLADRATRDGGVAKPLATTDESGTAPRAGAAIADAAAATPPADAAAGDMTEVWIGQLWAVSPRGLCDPSGPWLNSPPMVQPMGYTNRAVLILDHVGGELHGSIQLGDGSLPATPGDVSFSGHSDSSSFWICTIQLPTKGMEYALLDPVRTSDRLMFEISASDVWNGYCGKQTAACSRLADAGCELSQVAFDEVCTCEDGGCKAAPYNLVAFDLAITADTIEGELPSLGGAFGTPAELRLRRAQ